MTENTVCTSAWYVRSVQKNNWENTSSNLQIVAHGAMCWGWQVVIVCRCVCTYTHFVYVWMLWKAATIDVWNWDGEKYMYIRTCVCVYVPLAIKNSRHARLSYEFYATTICLWSGGNTLFRHAPLLPYCRIFPRKEAVFSRNNCPRAQHRHTQKSYIHVRMYMYMYMYVCMHILVHLHETIYGLMKRYPISSRSAHNHIRLHNKCTDVKPPRNMTSVYTAI